MQQPTSLASHFLHRNCWNAANRWQILHVLTDEGLLCMLFGEMRLGGRWGVFLSSQDRVSFDCLVTAVLCLLESSRACWYLW